MITVEQKEAIRKQSIIDYRSGKESCGLIVRGEVVVCENVHADPFNYFQISANDLARRDIQAIWHSHVNRLNRFSPDDVAACRQIGKPFILHEVVGDRWLYADPSYDADIQAQEFVYGINDCYSLVCRWYWQKRDVKLTNYYRTDPYDINGQYIFRNPEWDEFRRYFKEEGFRQLSATEIPQDGDVLLFQLSGAPNANHIGVLINAEEEEIFLHHLIGQPAKKDFWTGYYRENTIAILRYAKAKDCS